MNFYPRHLGDYARDAGHLSLVEHGVYTLLLDRFYATEKPFSEREAMQICRPANAKEREAVRRILADFFQSTPSGFVNKRALEEITKAHEKSQKAKESASHRWMRTHSERNADAMLSNNQYPITNSHTPKTEKKNPSPPAPTLAIAAQRGGGSGWVGDLVKPFSERK
jgi:uncharacterized protein YdaU (DUF1376 family)